MLLGINAPHFYAGVELRNGRVAITAPIVKWMLGMALEDVQSHCRRKGWQVTVMQGNTTELISARSKQ